MAEEAIKKSSLLGRGRRGYFLVFKKMFFKKVASSAMAEEAIKKSSLLGHGREGYFFLKKMFKSSPLGQGRGGYF